MANFGHSDSHKAPKHPETRGRPGATSDELNSAVIVCRADSASNATTIDTTANVTITINIASEVGLGSIALSSKVQRRSDCGGSEGKSVTSSTTALHDHVLIGLINDEFGSIGWVGDQTALSAVTRNEDVLSIGAGPGTGNLDMICVRDGICGGVCGSDLAILST